ncbi:MAG: hypothetical protein GTO22_26405 [Gemmatimonadales bacterium]|nr:hypothetical protein [Gemmatimonadales bacterium]
MWAVRTDGSQNILKFYCTGRESKKRCWYDVGTNNVRVLDKGNSTTWAVVDCSAYVPPSVDVIHFQAKFETGTKGSAADDLRIRRNGASQSQSAPAVGVKSGNAAAFQVSVPCDDDQKVEYKVDQAGSGKNEATLVVRGWDLDL